MKLSIQVNLMLSSFLVIASSTAAMQSAGGQSPKPIPNGCELNNNSISNAHHLAGEDSTIIAIAHLGTGERIRELNRRRLHNLKAYLTDSGWHRDPKTVVTAEGASVNGYGRIDLYVKGFLWASLAVRLNQDLAVGSCLAPDRNLYPYLSRRSRKPVTKP